MFIAILRISLIFLLLSPSVAHADLMYGLVGWWRLQDGTIGTTCVGASVTDSSGQGNTGTCNNSPMWVSGARKEGLSFNGSNQDINLSNDIPFGSSNFTLTTWFKTSSNTTGTFQQIWNSGYNGGNTDIEVILNNNLAGFYARDSSGNSFSSVTSISTVNNGNWHQVIGIRNGNVFSLYLDGAFQASVTKALGSVDTTSVSPIIGNGASSINNRWFNGTISDVRVYNRALSAQEVTDLYNNGASVNNAHLNNFKLNQ